MNKVCVFEISYVLGDRNSKQECLFPNEFPETSRNDAGFVNNLNYSRF